MCAKHAPKTMGTFLSSTWVWTLPAVSSGEAVPPSSSRTWVRVPQRPGLNPASTTSQLCGLGKLLSFSVPQFPLLYLGDDDDDDCTCLRTVWKTN